MLAWVEIRNLIIPYRNEFSVFEDKKGRIMYIEKTIKKVSVILLVLFASASFVLAMTDKITMRVTKLDGSTFDKVFKLEKVAKDTMRLRVPAEFFRRGQPNSYGYVKYVDLISEDATAMKGEEGYWVLSDGRLGEFTQDNGFIAAPKVNMQMYGFKKGNEAFVAIVKSLKYEFGMFVEAKNGVYRMFPRFHISKIGMKPYQDIEVDFKYFNGKNANYSAMGRAYRQYQLDRGEVVPLKERIKGNPRLKYTTDAVFLKFQMATFMREGETKLNRGFHWKDIDAPNIQIYRTYDNMMDVLKRLREMGIDKADIILTNWNWRSNGRCPIYGVAEPELGGNAKCRELTALGKKLGFQISPHILHTENYTVSPAFDKADLALQQNGEYIHYDGMGGEAYRPCFKQVYYKQVLENYTNMQQLGFNGPIHIDVTSAIMPYPCFDLNHYCTVNDTAFYMNQIGILSDTFFGGYTSESSVDSTANTLDYVLYVSRFQKQFGEGSPMVKRVVPIWQIVYNGIIMSNPFTYTIGYNERKGDREANPYSPQELRLKAVEFGARLTYYWNLRFDENFQDVKTAYDEYQKIKYLQLEFMDSHSEIAPNVFVTKYSDGSRVITNYSDKDFNYRGKGVVKAKDYKLFRAGQK